MPTLPTQSFTTIVQNIVAGIQGRSSKLINFAIGATLRAIAEGYASVFLWFQAMVLQLMQASRLSTATNTDVDTFTADFMPIIPGSQTAELPSGSPRLSAQAASGLVTFTRLTAGPSARFVPAASAVSAAGVITAAGPNAAATVQSSDGTQNFVVMANATLGTYSAALGGYTMAAGVGTLTVPVQALVPGAGGNVVAGAISVITSNLTGIDSVSNAAAFTNGANRESDGSLKERFAAYILGLSRGDFYGTQSSILSTAVTVQWTLTESYNLDGSWHPGYYFVVADDGSGSPSAAFLAAITNAANAVRPLSVWCSVFAPTIITANVSLQITTAAGYDHNTLVGLVEAAIANNINALGLGNPLEFGMIYSWAYAIAGVTGVSAVTLNGLSGDSANILATKSTQDGKQTIACYTIKPGTIAVS